MNNAWKITFAAILGLLLGMWAAAASAANPLVQPGVTESDSPAWTGTHTFTGSISSTLNAGTPGTGVTATEFGDGYHHLTRLALAGVLPDIAGTVAEAEGLLIYTFPAGVILVDAVHMDVSITQTEGFINADTPEIGVGTAIATGANATLGAAGGTTEDYVDGTAAANCTGTKTDLSEVPDATLLATGTNEVFLNVADTWAANGDAAAILGGDVWIAWRFLGV